MLKGITSPNTSFERFVLCACCEELATFALARYMDLILLYEHSEKQGTKDNIYSISYEQHTHNCKLLMVKKNIQDT